MSTVLLNSLLGGLLIGVAASVLLLGSGRVAGISGIVAGVIGGQPGARNWRLLFLIGLLAAPVLAWFVTGERGDAQIDLPLPLLLVSGLLVGIGTRRASGCTSGHGVCGLGNLSLRSLAAVMTFMGVAMVTVFVVRHVIGA